MKYRIAESVLEKEPNIVVYLLDATGLTNQLSDAHDEHLLRDAEQALRLQYGESDVRQLPEVVLYRQLLERTGTNPNRFPASIEAMVKRILKGASLPLINRIVDRGNAVSLTHLISLGAHDKRDIHEDLELRFSKEGDCFLPLGEQEEELVPAGELVFASGPVVQTRKGFWRQSDFGKTTLTSTDLYFHVVSFSSLREQNEKVLEGLKQIITDCGGTYQSFYLDQDQPEVEWKDS